VLIVSMYVVCENEDAPVVAERLNHMVTGFGLDGFETGMTVQTQEDDEEEVLLVEFDEGDT
jgi:hypothetical protein